jgi:hypothetical protein
MALEGRMRGLSTSIELEAVILQWSETLDLIVNRQLKGQYM